LSYSVHPVDAIQQIGDAAWTRFAEAPGCPADPFLSYAFLDALETSGSVGANTGWVPYHLQVKNEADALCGVMPLYLKGHSQGEYIFDYSWADAFERAGGRYYPKLLSAVPFTPATGRRLLTTDVAAETALARGAQQLADHHDISSVHINFLDQAAWRRRGEEGWLQRTHKQYHWQNQGYDSFDAFLSDLSSKKRKNIRRERRDALQGDLVIERLTGDMITETHWDHFFRFYMDTGNRKWGSPYLTRSFFSRVGETMADRILLVMCRSGDRYIAGAINFIGSECLFGRNWGCIEHRPFLHFEVCYYQAIEFAIERGLDRVEAGAQGEHKLARGYLPSETYSAHYIAHSGFKAAVDRFLSEERRYVSEEIDYLEQFSPFKSQS
jgi:predicted N-acyltransferase